MDSKMIKLNEYGYKDSRWIDQHMRARNKCVILKKNDHKKRKSL